MGSKAGMLWCESSEDTVSFPDPLSMVPAHKTIPNKRGPQLSPRPPHFWVYPSYLDAICAVAGRILCSLVSTGNPLAKHVLC